MSLNETDRQHSERPTGLPEPLRELSPEWIVDVDVRDDLRSGREPFARIMAARSELPDGGVLRVRAIFEPVPLYGVMAQHGLEHWTEELAEDDWRVWFFHPSNSTEGAKMDSDTTRDAPIELDVRPIPPRDKHSTIFQVFGGLEPGESFVLINDHDPLPLRYQFEAEHTDRFGWEYVEQGPEVWRVQISRT